MKTLKIVGLIILIGLLLIVTFAWWQGLFSRLEVKQKDAGGYILAGRNFVGDYAKVGGTMFEVDKILREEGIKSSVGFGIFFDNPNVTPKNKCRSFVGNVLKENDFSKIDRLRNLEIIIDTVDVKPAMVIEFPYKSRMSFFIGAMKAYPKFTEYIELHKLIPTLSMELYDMEGERITYIMQYQK